MLECKDCCLYNTEACRYGRYALEHNMSLNCDDFIVEHNKAYKQGRTEGRADVIGEEELQRFAQWLWDNHYLVDEAFTIRLVEQYKSEKMKEQKE